MAQKQPVIFKELLRILHCRWCTWHSYSFSVLVKGILITKEFRSRTSLFQSLQAKQIHSRKQNPLSPSQWTSHHLSTPSAGSMLVFQSPRKQELGNHGHTSHHHMSQIPVVKLHVGRKVGGCHFLTGDPTDRWPLPMPRNVQMIVIPKTPTDQRKQATLLL